MKKIITAVAVTATLATTAVTAKVIGSVNGYKITEQEANNLLKVLTHGKVKYAQLKPKDKAEVVKRLAVDKLVVKTAYRKLSKKERDFVIANAWMAKKTRKVSVSNSEAKKAYNQNKQLFKDKKGHILPFSKVKNIIKIQLKQRKVVQSLMKKAKIVVK